MTRDNDTTYARKGRALFLAAVMVLSVVAMSVAFAGGAAATQNEELDRGEVNGLDTVYIGEEFDINFTDAGNHFGDRAYLVSPNYDGGIDSFDQIDSTLNASDSDYAGFKGTFEIDDVEAGTTLLISNQSKFRTENNTNTTDTFSVQNTGLTAEFDSSTVDGNDKDAVIELDANRPITDMNLTVSADGFDADQLDELFNIDASDSNEVTEEEFVPLDGLGYDPGGYDAGPTDDDTGTLRDDGYVTLNLDEMEDNSDLEITGGGAADLYADFAGLDAGEGLPATGEEYEFEFYVTDTGTTTTASSTLESGDANAELIGSPVRETAGDIATIETELENTDEAYIQIGDSNSGFVDIVKVSSDSDDTNTVGFEVNLRTLGTNVSKGAVYNGDSNTTVDYSYVHSDNNAPIDTAFENSTSTSATFEGYLDDLGTLSQDASETPTDQIVRPLQPTDYDITVVKEDGNKLFTTDGDSYSAENRLESGLLSLTKPSVNSVTIHTAPEEPANTYDDTEELLSAATQRNSVAKGDQAIIQVEATGLYGALANKTGDFGNDGADALDSVEASDFFNVTDESGEGIDLTVEAQSSSGNSVPASLDLENSQDSNERVYVGPNEETFFIVVDMGDANFDTGSTIDATFEYVTNDDDQYKFNTSGINHPFDGGAAGDGSGDAAYPYFGTESDESATASFSYDDREVTFGDDHFKATQYYVNQDIDDDSLLLAELDADSDSGSLIVGETNVAPGTEGLIDVDSTQAETSFKISDEVTVADNGAFAAEIDFSGQSAKDKFDVEFSVDGNDVSDTEGILVDDDLDITDPTEVDDDGGDDGGDDGTADDGAADDGAADDGTADDGAADDGAADDGAADDGGDDGGDDSTDDGSPGFGAVVALVALIGAALLAVRRQN